MNIVQGRIPKKDDIWAAYKRRYLEPRYEIYEQNKPVKKDYTEIWEEAIKPQFYQWLEKEFGRVDRKEYLDIIGKLMKTLWPPRDMSFWTMERETHPFSSVNFIYRTFSNNLLQYSFVENRFYNQKVLPLVYSYSASNEDYELRKKWYKESPNLFAPMYFPDFQIIMPIPGKTKLTDTRVLRNVTIWRDLDPLPESTDIADKERALEKLIGRRAPRAAWGLYKGEPRAGFIEATQEQIAEWDEGLSFPYDSVEYLRLRPLIFLSDTPTGPLYALNRRETYEPTEEEVEQKKQELIERVERWDRNLELSLQKYHAEQRVFKKEYLAAQANIKEIQAKALEKAREIWGV